MRRLSDLLDLKGSSLSGKSEEVPAAVEAALVLDLTALPALTLGRMGA